jgi:hypothetical protein
MQLIDSILIAPVLHNYDKVITGSIGGYYYIDNFWLYWRHDKRTEKLLNYCCSDHSEDITRTIMHSTSIGQIDVIVILCYCFPSTMQCNLHIIKYDVCGSKPELITAYGKRINYRPRNMSITLDGEFIIIFQNINGNNFVNIIKSDFTDEYTIKVHSSRSSNMLVTNDIVMIGILEPSNMIIQSINLSTRELTTATMPIKLCTDIYRGAGYEVHIETMVLCYSMLVVIVRNMHGSLIIYGVKNGQIRCLYNYDITKIVRSVRAISASHIGDRRLIIMMDNALMYFDLVNNHMQKIRTLEGVFCGELQTLMIYGMYCIGVRMTLSWSNHYRSTLYILE